MHFGFSTMNTPEDPPPGELARSLEDHGFESLWMGEHSHIPVARRTPYPAGGEMPEQYTRMGDPFVSLTVAAGTTTTLRLGTSVALPLEHDVFALAKTVATLDHVSGGRFELGVGVGWNEEELADHTPIPWARRYRALADCVAALRALWTEAEAEHHGEFYDFDPVWAFPKPVQQPHPPVLLGAGGRVGVRHAVAWADGWAPMDVALGDVGKRLAAFRADVAAAGRSGVPVTLVTFGDPDADRLRGYAELGVARVILGAARTGWDDPTTTFPFVERWAPLAAELAPVTGPG